MKLGRDTRLTIKALEKGRGYKEGYEERNMMRRFIEVQRSDHMITKYQYTSKGARKEMATELFQKCEEIVEKDGFSITVKGLSENGWTK